MLYHYACQWRPSGVEFERSTRNFHSEKKQNVKNAKKFPFCYYLLNVQIAHGIFDEWRIRIGIAPIAVVRDAFRLTAFLIRTEVLGEEEKKTILEEKSREIFRLTLLLHQTQRCVARMQSVQVSYSVHV